MLGVADSSIISSLGGVPFERLGGVSVSADGVTTVKVFSPAQAATQEAALAEAERLQFSLLPGRRCLFEYIVSLS